MILKSKLLILIPILTIFSNNALAELRHYPIGNSQVRLGIDHSKSVVTDFRVDGQRFSGRIIEPAIVDHMPSGARASAKVPLTIEASVSRKAVLSGAFQLVKRGAALGSRLSGWGTAAYFAYEAYQAVNPSLESAGYEYNKEQGEFIKGYPDALCLKDRAVNSCVGIDSSIIKAKNKGGQSAKDAEELMRILVEKDFQKTSKIIIEDRYKGAYFQFCFYAGSGVSCQISTGTRFWYGAKNGLHSETLTEEKFLEIATPSIDGKPTPFVEGTGKPDYKENIKVPSGTVVTIGPVETPEGKKTYTVTFTNPTNGGSSEASVQTNNSPAPTGNTGGSPDVNSNGNPDGKPDGKPDDRPDDKPDDKPDGKDGKDGKDAQDLCEKHPEASACKDLGDTDYKDLEIPEKAINLELKPLDIFSTNGTCPANPTFSLGVLGTFEIPYDYFCNIARLLRPILILGTIIMCGFFAFNAVKEL